MKVECKEIIDLCYRKYLDLCAKWNVIQKPVMKNRDKNEPCSKSQKNVR